MVRRQHETLFGHLCSRMEFVINRILSSNDLQAILADIPTSVDTVVFPNYESMPERDDITDPFTEVSWHT